MEGQNRSILGQEQGLGTSHDIAAFWCHDECDYQALGDGRQPWTWDAPISDSLC